MTLPPGWSEARFGDLASIRLGKMLDRAKNTGDLTLYLRNVNVRWFNFDLSDLKEILIPAPEKDLLSIQDGDLLICEGGEPGRCAVWRRGPTNLVYQKALHRVRAHTGVVPELLMYRLRADALTGRLAQVFTGTTIKHLTGESLARYVIPVPPAAEQIRLTSKIWNLMQRVHTCQARLERIPHILRRFREAVLEAAVSGKLTEEWRGRGDRSWPILRLESLILELRNGLSPKPAQTPPGSPILRINSVRPFSVSEEEIRFLRTDLNTQSFELREKDLLFTRYSGSLEYVGVCGMVRSMRSRGLLYPDKLMRVRVKSNEVQPEWIEIVANSPSVRRIIERVARTSAGQTGISGGDLKALPIPVPSIKEQLEIVRRVGGLFEILGRLELGYKNAVSSIEKLKPSLLAKAFRGELVPQDSADEPARVLLERIRKGREGETAGKRRETRNAGSAKSVTVLDVPPELEHIEHKAQRRHNQRKSANSRSRAKPRAAK